jgi:hypothetical protein
MIGTVMLAGCAVAMLVDLEGSSLWMVVGCSFYIAS